MKLRMAIFAAGLSLGALWLVFAGDVKSWTPPPGPPPKLAYADVRRRLLLVHGAAVRRGAGRLLDDVSGYAGGKVKNPTYEQVSSGGTGHAESVRVGYDPQRVTYEQLLEVYWRNVDPIDGGGQFCDRGTQYRPAIFYGSEEQKQAALASKKALEASGGCRGPVAVQIVPLEAFYPAEDYHQDFYKKNAFRYKTYRMGCGRDRRLEAIWGKEAGGHGVAVGRRASGRPPGKDGRQ